MKVPSVVVGHGRTAIAEAVIAEAGISFVVGAGGGWRGDSGAGATVSTTPTTRKATIITMNAYHHYYSYC